MSPSIICSKVQFIGKTHYVNVVLHKCGILQMLSYVAYVLIGEAAYNQQDISCHKPPRPLDRLPQE